MWAATIAYATNTPEDGMLANNSEDIIVHDDLNFDLAAMRDAVKRLSGDPNKFAWVDPHKFVD